MQKFWKCKSISINLFDKIVVSEYNWLFIVSLPMKTIESKEKMSKRQNIVIMWFGELWQWFYDILKETNSNVYVVSVSGKNNKMYEKAWIRPYNRYEWFPILYENIDAVLLCCRTDQLEAVKALIPKEIFPKVVDKLVLFQNGFGIKELSAKIFGKNLPRCVPNLSFKRHDGKNITLTFAKASPIKWIEKENIKNLIATLNNYTSKKFGKYLFEWVDSIALHREGEYKAFINAVLNSLCVVYHDNVQHSIQKFTQEFGKDALDLWAKEIGNVINITLKDSVFETNVGEVKYYLETMIEKFANEKPSTYNQYYDLAPTRGKVLSEDEHLLGYIIAQARKHNILIPISMEIRKRMKNIEEWINNNLQNN